MNYLASQYNKIVKGDAISETWVARFKHNALVALRDLFALPTENDISDALRRDQVSVSNSLMVLKRFLVDIYRAKNQRVFVTEADLRNMVLLGNWLRWPQASADGKDGKEEFALEVIQLTQSLSDVNKPAPAIDALLPWLDAGTFIDVLYPIVRTATFRSVVQSIGTDKLRRQQDIIWVLIKNGKWKGQVYVKRPELLPTLRLAYIRCIEPQSGKIGELRKQLQLAVELQDVELTAKFSLMLVQQHDQMESILTMLAGGDSRMTRDFLWSVLKEFIELCDMRGINAPLASWLAANGTSRPFRVPKGLQQQLLELMRIAMDFESLTLSRAIDVSNSLALWTPLLDMIDSSRPWCEPMANVKKLELDEASAQKWRQLLQRTLTPITSAADAPLWWDVSSCTVERSLVVRQALSHASQQLRPYKSYIDISDSEKERIAGLLENQQFMRSLLRRGVLVLRDFQEVTEVWRKAILDQTEGLRGSKPIVDVLAYADEIGAQVPIPRDLYAKMLSLQVPSRQLLAAINDGHTDTLAIDRVNDPMVQALTCVAQSALLTADQLQANLSKLRQLLQYCATPDPLVFLAVWVSAPLKQLRDYLGGIDTMVIQNLPSLMRRQNNDLQLKGIIQEALGFFSIARRSVSSPATRTTATTQLQLQVLLQESQNLRPGSHLSCVQLLTVLHILREKVDSFQTHPGQPSTTAGGEYDHPLTRSVQDWKQGSVKAKLVCRTGIPIRKVLNPEVAAPGGSPGTGLVATHAQTGRMQSHADMEKLAAALSVCPPSVIKSLEADGVVDVIAALTRLMTMLVSRVQMQRHHAVHSLNMKLCSKPVCHASCGLVKLTERDVIAHQCPTEHLSVVHLYNLYQSAQSAFADSEKEVQRFQSESPAAAYFNAVELETLYHLWSEEQYFEFQRGVPVIVEWLKARLCVEEKAATLLVTDKEISVRNLGDLRNALARLPKPPGCPPDLSSPGAPGGLQQPADPLLLPRSFEVSAASPFHWTELVVRIYAGECDRLPHRHELVFPGADGNHFVSSLKALRRRMEHCARLSILQRAETPQCCIVLVGVPPSVTTHWREAIVEELKAITLIRLRRPLLVVCSTDAACPYRSIVLLNGDAKPTQLTRSDKLWQEVTSNAVKKKLQSLPVRVYIGPPQSGKTRAVRQQILEDSKHHSEDVFQLLLTSSLSCEDVIQMIRGLPPKRKVFLHVVLGTVPDTTAVACLFEMILWQSIIAYLATAQMDPALVTMYIEATELVAEQIPLLRYLTAGNNNLANKMDLQTALQDTTVSPNSAEPSIAEANQIFSKLIQDEPSVGRSLNSFVKYCMQGTGSSGRPKQPLPALLLPLAARTAQYLLNDVPRPPLSKIAAGVFDPPSLHAGTCPYLLTFDAEGKPVIVQSCNDDGDLPTEVSTWGSNVRRIRVRDTADGPLEVERRLFDALGISHAGGGRRLQATVITPQVFIACVRIRLLLECQTPIVCVGETGCGKTLTFRTISGVLGKELRIIEVHPAVTRDILTKRIQDICTEASGSPEKHFLVFLDEVNTSPEQDYVKQILMDRTFCVNMKPVEVPSNVSFAAACNPYRCDGDNSPVYSVEAHTNPSVEVFSWSFSMNTAEEEGRVVKEMCEASNTRLGNAQVFPDNVIQYLVGIVPKMTAIIRERQRDRPVSFRDFARVVSVLEGMQPLLETLKAVLSDTGLTAAEQGHLAVWVAFVVSLRDVHDGGSATTPKQDAERLAPEIFATKRRVAKAFLASIIQHATSEDIKTLSCHEALEETVLLCFICIYTGTPLFCVGPPGSGKSLAPQVLLQGTGAPTGAISRLPTMVPFTLQCSIYTTQLAIEDVFNSASRFEDRSCKAVVMADELALADNAPGKPLKVLNFFLDSTDSRDATGTFIRPAFVGTSNFALDRSQMNRVVTLSRSAPRADVIQALITNTGHALAAVQAVSVSAVLANCLRGVERASSSSRANTVKTAMLSAESTVGMRDVYAFIRALCADVQSGKGSSPTHYLRAMVQCFGVPFTTKTLLAGNPAQQQIITSKRSTLEWKLLESFLETLQNRNEHCFRRPVMIQAESFSLLRAIMDRVATMFSTSVHYIFGSVLQPDRSMFSQHLQEFTSAMEMGKICVVIGAEYLYEALMDVFNNFVTRVGTRMYSRVSLNGDSEMISMAPGFRGIVALLPGSADALSDAVACSSAFYDRFERRALRYCASTLSTLFPDAITRLKGATHLELIPQAWQALILANPQTFIFGYHPLLCSHCTTTRDAELVIVKLLNLPQIWSVLTADEASAKGGDGGMPSVTVADLLKWEDQYQLPKITGGGSSATAAFQCVITHLEDFGGTRSVNNMHDQVVKRCGGLSATETVTCAKILTHDTPDGILRLLIEQTLAPPPADPRQKPGGSSQETKTKAAFFYYETSAHQSQLLSYPLYAICSILLQASNPLAIPIVLVVSVPRSKTVPAILDAHPACSFTYVPSFQRWQRSSANVNPMEQCGVESWAAAANAVAKNVLCLSDLRVALQSHPLVINRADRCFYGQAFLSLPDMAAAHKDAVAKTASYWSYCLCRVRNLVKYPTSPSIPTADWQHFLKVSLDSVLSRTSTNNAVSSSGVAEQGPTWKPLPLLHGPSCLLAFGAVFYRPSAVSNFDHDQFIAKACDGVKSLTSSKILSSCIQQTPSEVATPLDADDKLILSHLLSLPVDRGTALLYYRCHAPHVRFSEAWRTKNCQVPGCDVHFACWCKAPKTIYPRFAADSKHLALFHQSSPTHEVCAPTEPFLPRWALDATTILGGLDERQLSDLGVSLNEGVLRDGDSETMILLALDGACGVADTDEGVQYDLQLTAGAAFDEILFVARHLQPGRNLASYSGYCQYVSMVASRLATPLVTTIPVVEHEESVSPPLQMSRETPPCSEPEETGCSVKKESDLIAELKMKAALAGFAWIGAATTAMTSFSDASSGQLSTILQRIVGELPSFAEPLLEAFTVDAATTTTGHVGALLTSSQCLQNALIKTMSAMEAGEMSKGHASDAPGELTKAAGSLMTTARHLGAPPLLLNVLQVLIDYGMNFATVSTLPLFAVALRAVEGTLFTEESFVDCGLNSPLVVFPFSIASQMTLADAGEPVVTAIQTVLASVPSLSSGTEPLRLNMPLVDAWVRLCQCAQERIAINNSVLQHLFECVSNGGALDDKQSKLGRWAVTPHVSGGECDISAMTAYDRALDASLLLLGLAAGVGMMGPPQGLRDSKVADCAELAQIWNKICSEHTRAHVCECLRGVKLWKLRVKKFSVRYLEEVAIGARVDEDLSKEKKCLGAEYDAPLPVSVAQKLQQSTSLQWSWPTISPRLLTYLFCEARRHEHLPGSPQKAASTSLSELCAKLDTSEDDANTRKFWQSVIPPEVMVSHVSAVTRLVMED